MRLALLAGLVLLALPSVALAETCFLCGSDSTDGCAGAQQCRGTRESCRDAGCKISGTASCSTAANVKICASGEGVGEGVWRPDLEPVMEDCFLCGGDSTGACSGAQQCRGTRESCRESGCKITGTGSCSTAANMKICAFVWREDLEPEMSWAPEPEHSPVH